MANKNVSLLIYAPEVCKLFTHKDMKRQKEIIVLLQSWVYNSKHHRGDESNFPI